MIEAIIVFSRKGFFNKKILAREIHSREHARKLWPLVTSDGYKHLVTWVKPSFKEGKLTRKSHFRILTGKKT